MAIRAILIDDDGPALRELEVLLDQYRDISIVGMYKSSSLALLELSLLKPQVVFMDIQMSQITGIEAAKGILERNPDTDIVFVTRHEQYAVEAFELPALDYIIKPVGKERLQKTLERLKKKHANKDKKEPKLQIKCLGRFYVAWENQEPIKWRTEKVKELFAYLLYNHGRDITKEELLDNLWTEYDPHKAIRQLYNGIYYIRKALEEYRMDRDLICIGNNYNLKLGLVDFDVQRFQEFEESKSEASIEDLQQMEALYTGDYLQSEYYPWADFERERLAKIYIQSLIKLAKKLIQGNQMDRAENFLLKAYHKNPYEQHVTELLLQLYVKKGDKSKAIKHFLAYSNLIRAELGIKPHKKLHEMAYSI